MNSELMELIVTGKKDPKVVSIARRRKKNIAEMLSNDWQYQSLKVTPDVTSRMIDEALEQFPYKNDFIIMDTIVTELSVGHKQCINGCDGDIVWAINEKREMDYEYCSYCGETYYESAKEAKRINVPFFRGKLTVTLGEITEVLHIGGPDYEIARFAELLARDWRSKKDPKNNSDEPLNWSLEVKAEGELGPTKGE